MTMEYETVGDALPKQMKRVREEVMPAYAEIGPSGAIAIALMNDALDKAARAMAEGDLVEMIRSLVRLQGFSV